MLTYERARELFDYDPETGVMTRRKSVYRAKAGQVVGTFKHGYLSVVDAGKRYYVHRIAWLLVHGEWPEGEIDHIDRNRSNNALLNLRIATHFENLRNSSIRSDNRTGIPGVEWDAARQKWYARIGIFNRTVFIGRFDSLSEAATARFAAEKRYHGEFSRNARQTLELIRDESRLR